METLHHPIEHPCGYQAETVHLPIEHPCAYQAETVHLPVEHPCGCIIHGDSKSLGRTPLWLSAMGDRDCTSCMLLVLCFGGMWLTVFALPTEYVVMAKLLFYISLWNVTILGQYYLLHLTVSLVTASTFIILFPNKWNQNGLRLVNQNKYRPLPITLFLLYSFVFLIIVWLLN